MGLNQSGKIFLIAGLMILSIGYLFHTKNIGDITGVLFMISGSSFILASFVEFVPRWLNLKF